MLVLTLNYLMLIFSVKSVWQFISHEAFAILHAAQDDKRLSKLNNLII